MGLRGCHMQIGGREKTIKMGQETEKSKGPLALVCWLWLKLLSFRIKRASPRGSWSQAAEIQRDELEYGENTKRKNKRGIAEEPTKPRSEDTSGLGPAQSLAPR